MKPLIPEGWYELNPNDLVYRGDKVHQYGDWQLSDNYRVGGGPQSKPYTYIREINSKHSKYNKETMKNIDITLTADEAVVIWRLFNELGVSYKREEFERSGAYRSGFAGGDGYSNLEKEWKTIHDPPILWGKINTALHKANIIASRYKAEPAIMVGGNEVKFENGQIKVGCTVISNELVKQIAAKLK
jgi:hypothetical protein